MLTKQQLLMLQKQLVYLATQHADCQAIQTAAAAGDATALAKQPLAQQNLDTINNQLKQLQQQLHTRLSPIATEQQGIQSVNKIYQTQKYRDEFAKVAQSITLKHPQSDLATGLQNLFQRQLLQQTIERLDATRDALARNSTRMSFEPSQAERRNMQARAQYIAGQVAKLNHQLQQIPNPLDPAEDGTLSDSQRQLQEAFQTMNLGGQAETMAVELAHAQLLSAPATSVKNQPDITYGAVQHNAFKRITKLTTQTEPTARLKAVQQVVDDLLTRAPWDGSTQSNYAESSQTAAKINNLLAAVPTFDRAVDTHPAKQGQALDPAINTVLTKLEDILGQIRNLAAHADELSNKLRDPSIDTITKKELLREFESTYEQLQKMGNVLNTFLYEHATTFNTTFRHHQGNSVLSIITQQKLNELVRFNDRLIDTMRSQLSTEVKSSFHNNWWVNRDTITRVGGSNSSRRHQLRSNPGFANFYHHETRCQTYEKYGFLNLLERKIESELSAMNLPIHGPKLPANATREQIEESKNLSVLAAAKEAFGPRWQEHVFFKNGGRDLRVEWDNKEQKEAFIKAMRSRQDKYTNLMSSLKDPKITATQQLGTQDSETIKATVQQWRNSQPTTTQEPTTAAEEPPAAATPRP